MSDYTSQNGGNEKNYYDPDFTEEISTKMRVPQRLSVIDPEMSKPIETIGEPHIHTNTLFMHVPDRILIGGGGEHFEGRDPLPEAKLERNIFESEPIQLMTPPRTLTLDSHSFPDIPAESKKVKFVESDNDKMNSSIVITPPGDISNLDELSAFKKQLRDTRRRLALLEAENRERQQREVAFCSVALFYFVIKGVFWVYRNL